MTLTKQDFIKLAIDCEVLNFGEFTLKSGRVSPYFFNAGLFYKGTDLQKLGMFYADVLIKSSLKFNHLFGPAYKGLPLATATAIALATKGIETTVTFNRKERKNHGEGGDLIGSPLAGNTVIIDDVITAGTAFREAQQLIKENGGKLIGAVIALDRFETGENSCAAIKDIETQGIRVFSIITIFDLIDYLKTQGEHALTQKIIAYQKEYGFSI